MGNGDRRARASDRRAGSRAGGPVADNKRMPTPHTIILHSGGLRSLVATALTIENDDKTRLSFLYINDGRDNTPTQVDHVHRQAEHFSVIRVNQIDLTHLYAHGHGKGPDGMPMGSFVTPQLLLTALSHAQLQQAQQVVWSASFDGDVEAMAQATEQVVLADQFGDFETGDAPRVVSPLLELTDQQVIELGAELDVPWHLSWSCLGSADIPCRACAGCRRRKAAFKAAGLTDPIEKPVNAVI